MIKQKISALFFCALLLSVSACEQQGPAEAAGERVDDLTQDIGNQIEDACEDVKEGMKAGDTDC